MGAGSIGNNRTLRVTQSPLETMAAVYKQADSSEEAENCPYRDADKDGEDVTPELSHRVVGLPVLPAKGQVDNEETCHRS